ncbi:unnamed protein product [Hermetia illucens]|uniref:DUF7041 domain-containing protein n=1 Tax=Hermetia illucens TaxID=343691 RepID=A0A7R8YXL6_HERIL|nr:unnamed protein product [Hermetia illucens]
MSFDSKDAVGPSDPQVSALAVRVPPFWRRNPELWFVHLEAQFQMPGITSDATRFNYAVVGLDEESILLVSDVAKSASYTQLKSELIRRLSASESAKLDHLLAGLTLGDRTPSQLLREMRQLGGSKIGDDLIKSLWLRRLREGTQAILACVSGSLEELAATPDQVQEVYVRPTLAAVQPPSDEVGDLRREIAASTLTVCHPKRAIREQVVGTVRGPRDLLVPPQIRG